MEPMLHTGDLVVATRQSDYQIGDIVVFDAPKYGVVIHALSQRLSDGDWKTKGINNSWTDQWTVPTESIRGVYRFAMPGLANATTWVMRFPLPFAAVMAAVTLLPYAPWRRRKYDDVLKTALHFGTKEPRRDGRTNGEYATLIISAIATLSVASMTLLRYANRTLFTSDGGILLAGTALSLTFTVLFVYRLYDGMGVAEPAKSMYAMAGRLYLVEKLPDLDIPAQPVKSAVELRTIAEKYRLPVLHHIDPADGRHSFLLITVQKGSFIWRPSKHAKPKWARLFEAQPKQAIPG